MGEGEGRWEKVGEGERRWEKGDEDGVGDDMSMRDRRGRSVAGGWEGRVVAGAGVEGAGARSGRGERA